MSEIVNNERLKRAIHELKSGSNPLFGSKYKFKNKLKQRIKKNKNFESISKMKKLKMMNSSFGGIKALALKSGISSKSKEFKAVLDKGSLDSCCLSHIIPS
jgi:spore coat protein CotH